MLQRDRLIANSMQAWIKPYSAPLAFYKGIEVVYTQAYYKHRLYLIFNRLITFLTKLFETCLKPLFIIPKLGRMFITCFKHRPIISYGTLTHLYLSYFLYFSYRHQNTVLFRSIRMTCDAWPSGTSSNDRIPLPGQWHSDKIRIGDGIAGCY